MTERTHVDHLEDIRDAPGVSRKRLMRLLRQSLRSCGDHRFELPHDR
jgi:hypothetical protein